MFISIKDLELRKLQFNEEFLPGTVDFGSDVRQLGPLKMEGRAELVREHHGGQHTVDDIRVVASLTGRMDINCARCIENVELNVNRSFDLLYRPLESEKGSDEVNISEAETEIGYYKGDGLELEDVLREQVLLAVPIKTVCRPDCKGLCPHCGKNRNNEPCDCGQKKGDPRWNALNGLRDKLQ
jgi:uncharacterized protein